MAFEHLELTILCKAAGILNMALAEAAAYIYKTFLLEIFTSHYNLAEF